MRSPFPFLLVVALVAASAPALAGGGKGEGHGDSKAPDEHGAGNLGAFDIAAPAHAVNGTFVSFSYNATGISGLVVEGVPLLDARVAGDPTGAVDAKADEAMIRVHSPLYTFTAHDIPLAVAKLEAPHGAVLTFGPGVVLTPRDEQQVGFQAGGLAGTIRAPGYAVVGQTLRAPHEALVFLESPADTSQPERADIDAAIGDGHVGAEATFAARAGALRQDVVSYANVTMTTLRAAPGNLTIQIDGHGTDGRVLVFNVDNALMNASGVADLIVSMDNQTLAQAPNLTSALDPDGHGFAPVYYVVFDPQANTFQMIVSVPHYSTHTLSVSTLVQEVPPSVVLGAVLGVVILVPSAFVLFRRPRG